MRFTNTDVTDAALFNMRTTQDDAFISEFDRSLGGSALATANSSGTGKGVSDPNPLDGALALGSPLPAPRLPVKVLVADREVGVLYAGAAPGLAAGLFQINVELPEDLATHQNLPIVLEVGGNRSLSGVTLSLRQ